MSAVDYKQHVKKARALLAEQKARPTMGHGFADFFSHYVTLSSAFEFDHLAKTHLVGLLAATLDLSKAKSALGYFNDGFEKLSKTIATFLAELTLNNPPEGAVDLLSKWIQINAIATVGLLEWAKVNSNPDKADPHFDYKFRNELLISLYFDISYPKICYQMMAETLKVKPAKSDLFIKCFESLSYIYAIETMKDNELVELFSNRLKENLETITLSLREVQSNFSPFIEQLQTALIKNDYAAFQEFWRELLSESNYPYDLFQQDLEGMKSLFTRINAAFQQSKIDKNTTIQLIG